MLSNKKGTIQYFDAYSICVRLGDTLGNHLWITLLVTGVSTVFALIPLSGTQELLTERAQDGLVELRLHELVSVHLMDLSPSLTDGSLSAETTGTGIQRPLADIFFD